MFDFGQRPAGMAAHGPLSADAGAGANPAPLRYLIGRLKRQMLNTKSLAGDWMLGADAKKSEAWKTSVRADFVATSLVETVTICVPEAGVATPMTEHTPESLTSGAHAVSNGSSSSPQFASVPG